MPRANSYLEQHLRSLRQACTDVYRVRGCAPPCPTCKVGDLCVTADERDSSVDDKDAAAGPTD
jgi:hypothetical protein